MTARSEDVLAMRPDNPQYLSDCDWGHCSNPATWVRYDAKFDDWLPVCNACASKPDGEAS